jgi:hypothetical protein
VDDRDDCRLLVPLDRGDGRRFARHRRRRGPVGVAGVATGAAMVGAPASGTYVTGVNYASLPAGSMTIDKNGGTYYLNGNTWFQPSYGANGVFYKVVPAP